MLCIRITMHALTELISNTARASERTRGGSEPPAVLGPLSAMTLMSQLLGPACSVEQLALSLLASSSGIPLEGAEVPTEWQSEAAKVRQAWELLEEASVRGGLLERLPKLSEASQNALLVAWWQRLARAPQGAESDLGLIEALVAAQALELCSAAAPPVRELVREAVADSAGF